MTDLPYTPEEFNGNTTLSTHATDNRECPACAQKQRQIKLLDTGHVVKDAEVKYFQEQLAAKNEEILELKDWKKVALDENDNLKKIIKSFERSLKEKDQIIKELQKDEKIDLLRTYSINLQIQQIKELEQEIARLKLQIDGMYSMNCQCCKHYLNIPTGFNKECRLQPPILNEGCKWFELKEPTL